MGCTFNGFGIGRAVKQQYLNSINGWNLVMTKLKTLLFDIDIILDQHIKRSLQPFSFMTRNVNIEANAGLSDLKKQFLDLDLIKKRLSSDDIQIIAKIDQEFIPKLGKYIEYTQDITFYQRKELEVRARLGKMPIMGDLGQACHEKFKEILKETEVLVVVVKKIINLVG